MKINLFLMGYKGYQVLTSIPTFELKKINNIICSRDKSLTNDFYFDIYNYCISKNLFFIDREDFNQVDESINIAISWRWLIHSNNTYIIHDSLLPKYRGFAPVISALCSGDSHIGVSLIEASENYDCGNIIFQDKVEITYPIKIESALNLLVPLYVNAIIYILNANIFNLPTTSQSESEATYSLWRNKLDYKINWNLDSDYIMRFIDSVGFPYDGAFSYTENGELVRIYNGIPINDVSVVNRDIGKVIFHKNKLPVIVCGKGLIHLTDFIYIDNTNQVHRNSLNKFRVRLI